MDALLERGEELAALESIVEAARDGRGQLVLVAGEAGIGKTSLVRALRERLGERAAFLVGVCEPLSVPVPLAPLPQRGGRQHEQGVVDDQHAAGAARGQMAARGVVEHAAARASSSTPWSVGACSSTSVGRKVK